MACGYVIPVGRLEALSDTCVRIFCKEDDKKTADGFVVFPPMPSGLAGVCPRCRVDIVVVYQNHTYKRFFCRLLVFSQLQVVEEYGHPMPSYCFR